MQSAVQRVTVIQRPIIRFARIIGRLILLLAIVGVIAAHFSRLYLSGSDDVIISPPATPVGSSLSNWVRTRSCCVGERFPERPAIRCTPSVMLETR